MNQADALDIVQSALWTIIVASGPAVGAAMAIGIIIALLQALTQVQEVTLTFIPKIIVILLVSSLTAPFVGSVIYSFAEMVYSRIENRLLTWGRRFDLSTLAQGSCAILGPQSGKRCQWPRQQPPASRPSSAP